MRELDIKSLAVAALVGAIILWLLSKRAKSALFTGALVGTAVQVSLRTFGVS